MTLREWCRANWNILSAEVRKECVDHLDVWFSPETKASDIEWLRNYEKQPGFHFLGGGMQIRNRLRDKLKDIDLPVVTKDKDGKPYGPSQNWDDYYTGAIDELLARHPKETV